MCRQRVTVIWGDLCDPDGIIGDARLLELIDVGQAGSGRNSFPRPDPVQFCFS